MKAIKLLIDDREDTRRIEEAFQYFNNVKKISYDAQVHHLKVGDFIFDDSLVFEYKTASDMINSIKNKRIFKQAKRMQQYPYHYIVVVGNVFREIKERYEGVNIPYFSRYHGNKKRYRYNFTENNYLGAVARLCESTNVIHVDNNTQCFTLMSYLADNILHSNKKIKGVDKPVVKLDNPVATFLCCMDDINEHKAGLITTELGLTCLDDLLSVEFKDLTQIKGIGAKTAQIVIDNIGK